MTKQYKTVDVPASTYQQETTTTCDLCHRMITGHSFNKDDVTIEYEHGWWYPESKQTETQAFDLCGKCWTDKLVPWFASQGATPGITKTDY